MSIVLCPRCGDKVTVPPAASPSALVQCPLCCEEYYLSDALIQLPPMLVVVGGHATAVEQEGDYRLAAPVSAAVNEAALDAGTGIGAAGASRPQLRTVSRPRRQEKSAVGEIIKVVLGGAAGLAGGLLVLWWGFGVDVGELGPKLSKVEYLRFLVPPKMWDQSVQRQKEPAQLDTLDADAKQAQGNGKNKKSATDSSQVASDDGTEGRSVPDGSGAPKNGVKQVEDDPFAVLGGLGDDTKGATSNPVELTIDDPLSTITPKKSDPPEAKGDKPTAESPKPAAEPTGEKPAEPTPAPTEKKANDEGSPAEDKKKPNSGEEPKPE